VPSEVAKTFSGIVVLRENLDETLLRKELETLGLSGAILKVQTPGTTVEKTRIPGSRSVNRRTARRTSL
jgi:hypothetical protein